MHQFSISVPLSNPQSNYFKSYNIKAILSYLPLAVFVSIKSENTGRTEKETVTVSDGHC